MDKGLDEGSEAIWNATTFRRQVIVLNVVPALDSGGIVTVMSEHCFYLI
jgi:hypothetical protein